ncbi:BA14K family protein [Bradyrhizobium roseum]|uniref:BA14K family protein n=1 Tax=Bradyrhizobium roseum TaxID=3056648 RepID=UPI00262ACE24|nr:BA14K family protein [Bradyrhizobium roseus]WKA30684.1 BA14K family protein [Bradyrhizobium roseus]
MTGTVVAQSADSQPRAVDDGPPPGACTPIGVTASGDIVFPMTCRDFIERHKAADRAASAAETKAAAPEASKVPDATETAKAPASPEAGKAKIAAESSKALTTGEASRASAAADVGAPTAVEASKAPTAPDSGQAEEKDTKLAPVKAAGDESDRPAIKQAAVAPPESADPVKSSADPATTAALDKRAKGRNRVAGAPNCTRFRTYNAASGTYRDFNGQRRPCP